MCEMDEITKLIQCCTQHRYVYILVPEIINTKRKKLK